MRDVVVSDGRVVTPSGVERLDVGIDGETITEIATPGTLSGEIKIDADGKYVLPGAIDPHTHHGITRTLAEDARSESRSDLYGGVTTTGNFFRRGKPYRDVLDGYVADAEANYHHDYFFSLGLLYDTHVEEIPWLVEERNITSFKWYMNYKNRVAGKFGVDGDLRDDFADKLLQALAAEDVPTTLGYHSENVEITAAAEDACREPGQTDYGVLTEAFPAHAEAQSMVAGAALARQHDYDGFYAVHISAGSTADRLAELQAAGYEATGETCAHYLAFTAEEADQHLKVNPPIRSEANRETLWERLADGTISCVGTDHCCKLADVKFGADIWEEGPAFPGSPYLLPLVLTEGVAAGRLSIERAVEVTSTNAAKAWNLYPKKGTIQVGSDADLVVVDLDETKTVTPELVDSAVEYSVYEGMELTGWPTHALVRGTPALLDGEITVDPGYGTQVGRPV